MITSRERKKMTHEHEMVTVLKTDDLVFLSLVTGELDQEDIPYFIPQGNLEEIMGGTHQSRYNILGPAELKVSEENEKRALEIIEQLKQKAEESTEEE